MIDLDAAKSYLIVDFDDKDKDIAELLESAKALIYTSTGCEEDKVYASGDKNLIFLYEMSLKIVLKNLYDEKEINGARLKSFYLRLKPLYYKVVLKNA